MESQIALESDPGQQQSADLTQQRQDFESQKARWQEDRQRLEADLEVRRQKLDRQLAELEAEAIQLELRRAVLSERETALAAARRFGGDQPSIEAPHSPVDQQTAEPPATASDANELTTSLESQAHSTAIDSSPVDQQAEAESVTGSFGNDISVPDRDAVDDEIGLARSPSDALVTTGPETASPPEMGNINPLSHLLPEEPGDAEPTATITDHEESIDDYMVRLLNRIRGGPESVESQSGEKAERRPATAQKLQAASPSTETAESAKAANDSTSVGPEGSMQLVARTAPPELTVNLRAMRELANLTARGAIDKHAQGRWSKAAVIKATQGGSSVLCGLWLLPHSTPLGIFGQMAGLVVLALGGFWIYQGVSLFRNIREVGRRTTRFVEAESHPMTHEVLPTADTADVLELGAATSDTQIRCSGGSGCQDIVEVAQVIADSNKVENAEQPA